ncbi:hypothetical protein [Escherichia coli]|nr:hypothetical protein [Escherichia coli]EHR1892054.1 hypothetical protein [Escherichia coli]EJC2653743.1 hypothetical protein [Escherichia coli]EZA15028.1 hypothetical protein BW75_08835 [Escherichia coli O81:NM str. 02-3012]MBA0936916.1 hypothetical protein [Escherichia coli]MCE2444801.1 hypothetical protein [Escherichia coli]
MTNEELQAIALSMLERQREKVHQQRESLLNPSLFTRPKRLELEAFLDKYPRRLKSGKTRLIAHSLFSYSIKRIRTISAVA